MDKHDNNTNNTAQTPDEGAVAAFPDFAALALGSLLSQKNSEAPRRERTAEERRADVSDMISALEIAMRDDE